MRIIFLLCLMLFPQRNLAQNHVFLVPDAIFDGQVLRQNIVVEVKDNRILFVGEMPKTLPPSAKVITLKGKTLLPGLIEAHSHVLLHPYNETSWNDQVLKESETVRVIRAVNHLRQSLEAGFTTLRDLGTEGAGYADTGLKQAAMQGLILSPRLLITTKAIIATGSYAPRRVDYAMHDIVQGAEEADGNNLVRVVRDQIGHGADWIKVYADYRWGLNGQAAPTFSVEELKLIVETAASSGRSVVAHAGTAEGMKRAVLAGVKTIEHGDGATAEVFALMKERGVALCPTLAAVESISQYAGWKKGVDPEPDRVKQKKQSFKMALDSGVSICNGSDVGVFSHGNNALELELMHEYGMSKLDVLKSATSRNAEILGLSQLGSVKQGFLADLIAVEGNPLQDLSALRKVRFVMLNGKVVVD